MNKIVRKDIDTQKIKASASKQVQMIRAQINNPSISCDHREELQLKLQDLIRIIRD